MLTAHLNGGPMDDQTVEVDWEILWVQKLGPLSFDPLSADADAAAPLPVQRGCYTPRRDDLGQLVPHSLACDVEFDWRGWQESG